MLRSESENRISHGKDLQQCRRTFLVVDAMISAILPVPLLIFSDVAAPLCMGFIPAFVHHPTENCETNPVSHLFSVYVCTTGLVGKQE